MAAIDAWRFEQEKQLTSLIVDIDSTLSKEEANDYVNMAIDTYGSRYNDCKTLLTLLQAFQRDSIVTPQLAADFFQRTLKCSISNANIISEISKKHQNKINVSSKGLESEFRGREDDLDELLQILHHASSILLYGSHGVGKTSLAKELCTKLKNIGFSIKFIDMRCVTTFESLLTSIANQFDQIIDINAISTTALINGVIEDVTEKTVLVLDSIDLYSNNSRIASSSKQSQLMNLVIDILKCNKNFKMIMTSCQANNTDITPGFVHQKEVCPLQRRSSMEIMKDTSRSTLDKDFYSLANVCHDHPLELKLASSQIQFNGVTPLSMQNEIESVTADINSIKISDKHSSIVDTSEKTDVTNALLTIAFDRLSDTIQAIAVCMSLFPKSFNFSTFVKLLDDMEEQKLNLIIRALWHINFISVETSNTSDLLLDIHHQIKKFLSDKCKQEIYQKRYQSFKTRYVNYYIDKLKALAKMVNHGYNSAAKAYKSDEENYNVVYEICEDGTQLIEDQSFQIIHNLNSLFELFIVSSRRLNLLTSLAQNASKVGKHLLSADYYGLASLQTLSSSSLQSKNCLRQGKFELSKKEFKSVFYNETQYMTSMALLLFIEGEIIYNNLITNFDRDHWKIGLSLHQKALHIRKTVILPRTQGQDAIDIHRSYNAIGNYHLKMAEYYDTTEEKQVHLQMALNNYRSTVDEKYFASDEYHLDMPIFLQNLASAYDQMGSKTDAINTYNEALEIEKVLEIDTYLGAALILKNLSNLYIGEKRYNEALPLIHKAVGIRMKLLGYHRDTVRSIYSLAVTYHGLRDYENAVSFFFKAFEMEETLSEHSALREKVRDDLLQVLCIMIDSGRSELIVTCDRLVNCFEKLNVSSSATLLEFVEGTYLEKDLSYDLAHLKQKYAVLEYISNHVFHPKGEFKLGLSNEKSVHYIKQLGVRICMPVPFRGIRNIFVKEVKPSMPLQQGTEVALSGFIEISASDEVFKNGVTLDILCIMRELPSNDMLTEVAIKYWQKECSSWITIHSVFDNQTASAVIYHPGIFVAVLQLRGSLVKIDSKTAFDVGPVQLYKHTNERKECFATVKVNRWSQCFCDGFYSCAGAILSVELTDDVILESPCEVHLKVRRDVQLTQNTHLHILRLKNGEWDTIHEFQWNDADQVIIKTRKFSFIVPIWSYLSSGIQLITELSSVPLINMLRFDHEVLLYVFEREQSKKEKQLHRIRIGCSSISPAHEDDLRSRSSRDNYCIVDTCYSKLRLRCGEELIVQSIGRYKLKQDERFSFFTHRPNWVNVTLHLCEDKDQMTSIAFHCRINKNQEDDHTKLGTINLTGYNDQKIDDDSIADDRWQFLGITLNNCKLDELSGNKPELWSHLASIGIQSDDIDRITLGSKRIIRTEINRLCLKILQQQFIKQPLDLFKLRQCLPDFGPPHVTNILKKVLDVLLWLFEIPVEGEKSILILKLIDLTCSKIGPLWIHLALNLHCSEAFIENLVNEETLPDEMKCRSMIANWSNEKEVCLVPLLLALQQSPLDSLRNKGCIIKILDAWGDAIMEILD